MNKTSYTHNNDIDELHIVHDVTLPDLPDRFAGGVQVSDILARVEVEARKRNVEFGTLLSTIVDAQLGSPSTRPPSHI